MSGLPAAATPDRAMKTILNLAAFLLLLSSTACAREDRRQAAPYRVENGLVVSQELHASEAGLSILRKGGNAVDAAIATAFEPDAAAKAALAEEAKAAGQKRSGVKEMAHGTATAAHVGAVAKQTAATNSKADRDKLLEQKRRAALQEGGGAGDGGEGGSAVMT